MNRLSDVKILGLFLLLALFQGCAGTRISTFKDPDFSNQHFKRIVIASGLKREYDASLFQSISSKVMENHADVQPIKYESLFFPTRTYSNDEFNAIVKEQGIDGFLFFSLQDAGSETSYIPQYGSQTTVRPTYGGGYNATTYNYGGYNITKPYFSFKVELVDSKSGRKAWIADSSTGGNAFADWNILLESLSDKVVRALISEGLVEKGKESETDNRSAYDKRNGIYR